MQVDDRLRYYFTEGLACGISPGLRQSTQREMATSENLTSYLTGMVQVRGPTRNNITRPSQVQRLSLVLQRQVPSVKSSQVRRMTLYGPPSSLHREDQDFLTTGCVRLLSLQLFTEKLGAFSKYCRGYLPINHLDRRSVDGGKFNSGPILCSYLFPVHRESNYL